MRDKYYEENYFHLGFHREKERMVRELFNMYWSCYPHDEFSTLLYTTYCKASQWLKENSPYKHYRGTYCVRYPDKTKAEEHFCSYYKREFQGRRKIILTRKGPTHKVVSEITGEIMHRGSYDVCKDFYFSLVNRKDFYIQNLYGDKFIIQLDA